MAFIDMRWVVMVYVAMAFVVVACMNGYGLCSIIAVCIVIAYVGTTCIVMAYTRMACMLEAYMNTPI